MSANHSSQGSSPQAIEQKIKFIKDLEKMEKWQFNYLTGTKYELYRVPFKKRKFEGLKFKEVCMIMYHKLNMTLIGLEIKVGN